MTEINELPTCGKETGITGLPCLRWPGHAGDCHNGTAFDDPEFARAFKGDQDLFDDGIKFMRRAVVFGIVAWALCFVSLGLGIYNLVR